MAAASDPGIPSCAVIEPLSVPSELVCAICQELCLAPVITTGCFHIFCSSCMRRARASSSQCPKCRAYIGDARPLKTANPPMHRVYCSISLRCPFAASESCTWTGSPDDFESHSARCRRSSSSGSDSTRLRAELATAQARIIELEDELEDEIASHEQHSVSSPPSIWIRDN